MSDDQTDLDFYVDEFVQVMRGSAGSVFLGMAADCYEPPSWPNRESALASLRAAVVALEEAE